MGAPWPLTRVTGRGVFMPNECSSVFNGTKERGEASKYTKGKMQFYDVIGYFVVTSQDELIHK